MNTLNFSWLSGSIVILVGVLGMIGHGLESHFLKSYLPWRSQEIPLSSSIALTLLGIAIVQGIPPRKTDGWQSNTLLLLAVLSIALFIIGQHFVLSDFQIYLALIEDFSEIPMAFLTSLQLLSVSVGLLIFNRYYQSWWATLMLGIVAFWLLETVVFALLGFWADLPVLFSYLQALPVVIAFSAVGIALLQGSLPHGGLLIPLFSGMRRIRLFALVSVLSGTLIVIAGGLTVNLFDTLVTQRVAFPHPQIDLLFLGVELATISLSILVMVLSLKVLFFYESSLRAEEGLRRLNQELEGRVKERTEELARANRQQARVLSMVSHDLKTPLAAVGRFAEVMFKEEHLSERQQSLIGYIAEGVHQMQALVTDVLDRARIEAGKVAVKPQKISVALFINNLVPTIQTLAEEKLLDVKVEVPPDLEVIADPLLLRQILLNLLSNAAKYNKRNGKIWLRACEDPNQGYVEIAVQDTGIGIEASKMPLLFSDFYRIGAGLNSVEGAGLGLACTKKLVDLHKGSIQVSSMEGQGSTFKVLFPKREEATESTLPSRSDAINKKVDAR